MEENQEKEFSTEKTINQIIKLEEQKKEINEVIEEKFKVAKNNGIQKKHLKETIKVITNVGRQEYEEIHENVKILLDSVGY